MIMVGSFKEYSFLDDCDVVYETIADTSIYSFYPGINIINLDYNGYTNEFSMTNLGQDHNLITSLSIISHK